MGSIITSKAQTPPPEADEIRPNLRELFKTIETQVQTTSIGDDRWYLVVIAVLVAGPDPEVASQLYLHLCSQPRYSTPEARQALIRRLREALVKAVSIVGVCKPIEAILAISKVERPEDRDYSSTREDWQCDDDNLARSRAWYEKIYTHNSASVMELFRAHRDFEWISKHITYGLYLGDRQVLDDLETELIVFPAIMAQNLPTETWWHMRGMRRIGVSQQDTKVLWESIKLIMAHFGVKLDKVPTVEQVESDVS